MASILQVSSSQPARIQLALTEGTPSVVASDYTLTRADGGSCPLTVAVAFLRGSNTVELCLSGKMLPDLGYVVTVSGAGSAPVGYRLQTVPDPTIAPTPDDDPEAEIFGVDLPWLVKSLTPQGRLARRRGLECWLADQVNVAMTLPGELLHRPRAGAGLPEFVNASSTEKDQAVAALQTAWGRDPRTESVTVEITPNADGEFDVSATFVPAPLPDSSFPLGFST